MNMLNFFKGKKDDKKSDFVIEEDDGDDTESPFIKSMQVNLSRLIVYAESADVTLQREVAEKLANEAVKPNRQVQIVEYGGLKLLIPLTRSVDQEVQRLTAHALANLSVNGKKEFSIFHGVCSICLGFWYYRIATTERSITFPFQSIYESYLCIYQ